PPPEPRLCTVGVEKTSARESRARSPPAPARSGPRRGLYPLAPVGGELHRLRRRERGVELRAERVGIGRPPGAQQRPCLLERGALGDGEVAERVVEGVEAPAVDDAVPGEACPGGRGAADLAVASCGRCGVERAGED